MISNAQKQLEKTLSQHIVFRAFIILKQMLINFLNKINCKQLWINASKLSHKYLIASLLDASNEHLDCFTNEKEWILTELWAKILCQDVKNIERWNDFLTLNDDSLAVIRLVFAMHLKNLDLTTQNILKCFILKDMTELAMISNIDLKEDIIMILATYLCW